MQGWLRIVIASACFGLPAFASWSEAAHPLITDDTGTQGKGRFQLELIVGYGWDKESDAGVEVKTKAWAGETALSYGILENMDVVVGLLRRSVEETVDGVSMRERGLSDGGLLVKWRFWESEHASFAVKPGLIVPLGSENKGLGAGKYGYLWFLIATQEWGKWAFHENLGQIRNNNRHDERENLYHFSVAGEYKMTERLRVVANIRQDQNPDKASKRKLSFLLGGLIYALTENVDIDIGYQAALTDPEMDAVVLAGLAWRF